MSGAGEIFRLHAVGHAMRTTLIRRELRLRSADLAAKGTMLATRASLRPSPERATRDMLEAQAIDGARCYECMASIDFRRHVTPGTLIDDTDSTPPQATSLPASARAIEGPGPFGRVDLNLNQCNGSAA